MSNEEIIIDQVCDHKALCNQEHEMNLHVWHVHTPTSEIARFCCVECIEKHMNFIHDLPEHKRQHYPLSAKESAKQLVVECISYGPRNFRYQFSTDVKFRAIAWCLERGFPPCSQIFEFTFPFSSEQLRFLASYGAFPTGMNLLQYECANLWHEIRTSYNNIPDTTTSGGVIIDNRPRKEEMSQVIYRHDFPIIVFVSLNPHLVNDCIGIVMEFLGIRLH